LSKSKWIEVNLGIIGENYKKVKDFVGDEVEVMAVLKGDAYGNGFIDVAKALKIEGVRYFALSNIEEGLQLRREGFNQEVLILDPILKEDMEEGISHNLTFTISDYSEADLLSEVGQAIGAIVRGHIYVDAGMNRGPISLREAKEFLKYVIGKSNIKIDGVYTHFPTAFQKTNDITPQLFKEFQNILAWLQEQGIHIPYKHSSCSAALLQHPNTHLNMVRVGTLLYGGYPNRHFRKLINLKNPWKLKVRILSMREANKGERIGYGLSVKLKRNTKIALIPLGYTDGFMVSTPERPLTLLEFFRNIYRLMASIYRGRGERIYINGKSVKLLGRVNMTNSIIDVTDIPKIGVGDVVEVKIRAALVASSIEKMYYNDSELSKDKYYQTS
jgi:alanine racemase